MHQSIGSCRRSLGSERPTPTRALVIGHWSFVGHWDMVIGHYFPVSCCTPRGVRSTSGKLLYSRFPVFLLTKSGIEVLTVTTQFVSLLRTASRTCSIVTAFTRWANFEW